MATVAKGNYGGAKQSKCALHPHVSVMLMSGSGETDAVQERLMQHDVPFLQKPFNAAQLASAVRRTLDERLAQSRNAYSTVVTTRTFLTT